MYDLFSFQVFKQFQLESVYLSIHFSFIRSKDKLIKAYSEFVLPTKCMLICLLIFLSDYLVFVQVNDTTPNPKVSESLDEFKLAQKSMEESNKLLSRAGIIEQKKLVEWTMLICAHLRNCPGADLYYQGMFYKYFLILVPICII